MLNQNIVLGFEFRHQGLKIACLDFGCIVLAKDLSLLHALLHALLTGGMQRSRKRHWP